MSACSFVGCGRNAHGRLCGGHWSQHYRGQELKPLRGLPRKLLPNPGYPGTLLVPLGGGGFAVIDEIDAEAVGKLNWSLYRDARLPWSSVKYARHGGVGLHRFIALAAGIVGPGQLTDHRNRDGLDCRRENLRAATHQQNVANRMPLRTNSSGFVGVCFDKTRGPKAWGVKIGDRPAKRIGWYADPVSAALAYDAAARARYGEFAQLNFPAHPGVGTPSALVNG